MTKKIVNLSKGVIFLLALTFISSCSKDEADMSAPVGEKANKVDPSQENKPKTFEGLVSTKDHEASHRPEVPGPKVGSDVVASDSVLEGSQDDLSDDTALEEDVYNAPSKVVSFSAQSEQGVVRWEQPQDASYSSAKITISNQAGETIVRDFGAGESIELYGELPDGLYKWESVIAPQISPAVREEMQSVRSSGDFNAERELVARLRDEGSMPTAQEARANVQSGSFRVVNGVVSPNLVDDPENDE